jgi:hypothetical protein
MLVVNTREDIGHLLALHDLVIVWSRSALASIGTLPDGYGASRHLSR